MFCSNCGGTVTDGATFCSACGRPLSATAAAAPTTPYVPAAGAPQQPIGAVAGPPQLFYAGFWLRFVAYIIDAIILAFAECAFAVILIFATGLGAMFRNLPENPTPDEFFTGTFIFALVVFIAGMVVMIWIYYAWMESSQYQGTLGKMALGLIVTDLQYQPISFARASGRFFAKFITGLVPLFIGYIMAGFTAKKQALHDMIAGCLVLRRI